MKKAEKAGPGPILVPGWKALIFFICTLTAGLFLLYPKKHLLMMRYMKPEKYLKLR
jgi:hypothetical protein